MRRLSRAIFRRSASKSTTALMRQGIDNMRKLVYAFYNPNFSFKEVVMKYPEAGGEITDCLSAAT
jgi:hypothetical protein